MRTSLLVLSIVIASTGCKSLPEPSPGVKRGPISLAIWGKEDSITSGIDDEFVAPAPAKYSGVYDEGYNWNYFFIAYMAMSEHFTYSQYATDLMRVFYNETYRKFKNDEFSFANQRESVINKVKADVSEFDPNQVHLMRTEFEFGKYNFNDKTFPLDSLSPTKGFNFKQRPITLPHNDFPKEFKLRFTNTEIIGDLEMGVESAKRFVQNKKTKSGTVVRKVPASFHFKLVEFNEAEKTFYAEILEGKVYYGKKDQRVVKSF